MSPLTPAKIKFLATSAPRPPKPARSTRDPRNLEYRQNLKTSLSTAYCVVSEVIVCWLEENQYEMFCKHFDYIKEILKKNIQTE